MKYTYNVIELSEMDAMRLQLLEAVDADEPDLLRQALQQAVGSLTGLGGLVHQAGRQEHTLQLVTTVGLPAAMAHPWELLDDAAAKTAPMQAAETSAIAWSSSYPGDEIQGEGSLFVPGGGVISVPILASGTHVGALSVVAGWEPLPEKLGFLTCVAELLGARLAAGPWWRRSTPPWWRDPSGPNRMREIQVGTWSWDLVTGLLDFDTVTEGLVRLAGLGPTGWDLHIETWMEHIHPMDRLGVQQAIDRSFETGAPFAVEYRVIGENRQVNWLELRAAFETDSAGERTRMVGTAWNTSGRRAQEAWVFGLLNVHPDPIYVVSPEDEVVWANEAGYAQTEDLGIAAGSGSMWGEASMGKTGMPNLLARARITPGATVTLRTKLGRTADMRADYHARAVEIEGFVALQLSAMDQAT